MNVSDSPISSELSEHHKAHGPNWSKWLAPFVGKPGAVGIELGTWKGEGAEWFLDHVLTDPSSRLHCVDTFKGSDEHRLAGIDCSVNHKEAIQRTARFGPPRVTFHVGETHRVLNAKFAGTLSKAADFIYVDAAHDAMNVLRDSVLAFDLLAIGGVMIWDDYDWAVMTDEVDRPKMAIDAFLSCYARRLEVIGIGWQVCARKVA